MVSEELKKRTKKFAVESVKFFRNLPKNDESKVLGRQLLRSATSVASNYRSSLRARSKNEFIAKLGIVVEEADESVFWLELLVESECIEEKRASDLLNESNELMKIFSSSRKTAKENLTKYKK